MKRYKTLLITAVVFVMTVVLGTVLLSGHADDKLHKTEQTLMVYTTLPPEHVTVLASEYEKQHRVQVKFEPMSAEKLTERLINEKKSPKADMVLTEKDVLEKAAEQQVFAEYVSEATDMVADSFCGKNDAWTGVWYDPVVICANSDYLNTLEHYPLTWKELSEQKETRIGMTDFLAADASANLLYYLVANYGEEKAFSFFMNIHSHIVQYSKYLSTPVRMAGMGEVDMAISVQSEALRYIREGYPLKVIYPSDGTAYVLTGVGILKESTAARGFADWLLGDEAQLALRANKFFFMSVNPDSMAAKTFAGKNLELFDKEPGFSISERRTILDKWVKNIRLK